MAKGDYVIQGTGTLPKSGPGVLSTVTITATGAGANDVVMVTPTSTALDTKGNFNYKVTGITTNTFVLTCDRPQLPEAMTFQYIVFDAA